LRNDNYIDQIQGSVSQPLGINPCIKASTYLTYISWCTVTFLALNLVCIVLFLIFLHLFWIYHVLPMFAITLTLLDIDECDNSPCQHNCTNTPGSFLCTCVDGYRLTGNTFCEGKCHKVHCCAKIWWWHTVSNNGSNH